MTQFLDARSFRKYLLLGAAVGLFACKSETTAPKPTVGSIVVTVTTPTLLIGQTSTATVVVKSTTGATLTDRAVTWQSGTPAVATVAGNAQGATITSVAAGTATVTATSEGITGNAAVTVNTPPNALSELVVAPTAPTIAAPGLTQVITTTPTLATGGTATYANTTSNAAIATVTTTGANPVVTAVGPGTATITITGTGSGALLTTNALVRTVAVTVNALPNALSAFVITPATATISPGGAAQIITTTPTLAAGATVVYANSTNNAGVATVTTTGANPVVTAVAPGTATITVMATGSGASLTTNSISRTATITVSAVSTVELTLAGTSLATGAGTTSSFVAKDLNGVVLPGLTASAWGSTNTAVATVNQTTGAITAVASGVTTISVTVGGRTGTADLAVCIAGVEARAGNNPRSFASATLGNDATGTGTCASPYKTITKSLTGKASGASVFVSPGTYNAALGETFPITVTTGVQLIGDEANKGQGAVGTKIVGSDFMTLTGQNCGIYSNVIYAQANTVIAGFELVSPVAAGSRMIMVMRHNNITVRNNVMTGFVGSSVLYMCNASVGSAIVGNVIVNNTSIGIGFIGGGAQTLVEGNRITGNGTGIEYDSEGGDLGGGNRGSLGNNIISCNSGNDIWTNTVLTITAANNFWDHLVLTGQDFFNGPGTTVLITTGAKLAAAPCA